MLSRRVLLKSTAILPLGAQLDASTASVETPSLPDKANFRVQEFETCLNAGRWHPLSNGARAGAERYQEYTQRGIWDCSSLWSPSNPDPTAAPKTRQNASLPS
jgi:hypothetical protein